MESLKMIIRSRVLSIGDKVCTIFGTLLVIVAVAIFICGIVLAMAFCLGIPISFSVWHFAVIGIAMAGVVAFVIFMQVSQRGWKRGLVELVVSVGVVLGINYLLSLLS